MQPARWTYALLLSLAAVVGCQKAQSKEAPAGPPPATVFYTLPVVKHVTDSEDFTGHTEAIKTVTIRARVTGYLEKVNFTDGADVQEGDVLFEIDPRPYQAQCDANKAQINLNEANLKLAKANNERYKALYKNNPGAVSMQDLDTYQAQEEQAVANLKLSKANLETSTLNLNWTRVTAPLSGRIGRRLVDPGNEVIADTTALTTIVSQDPIYAYFDVDEHTLLRIERLAGGKEIAESRHADQKLSLALTDEEGFPHEGAIDFSDNQVDPQTGTLRLRGVFPNPKHLLTPGLFARIRLPIGQPRDAVIVPERALATDQGRKFAYVIDKDDNAIYRKVTVGQTYGDGMRIITDGLSAGERIVVSGLQRIKPGAKVVPKLEQPEADANKTAADKPSAGKPSPGDKAASAEKPATAERPISPPSSPARIPNK